MHNPNYLCTESFILANGLKMNIFIFSLSTTMAAKYAKRDRVGIGYNLKSAKNSETNIFLIRKKNPKI